MLFFIVLLQKHFVDVSKSEEFLNLTKGEVLDILVRDELYVSTEEQVTKGCHLKQNVCHFEVLLRYTAHKKFPGNVPHFLSKI